MRLHVTVEDGRKKDYDATRSVSVAMRRTLGRRGLTIPVSVLKSLPSQHPLSMMNSCKQTKQAHIEG
jgi:hypothetical protein